MCRQGYEVWLPGLLNATLSVFPQPLGGSCWASGPGETDSLVPRRRAKAGQHRSRLPVSPCAPAHLPARSPHPSPWLLQCPPPSVAAPFDKVAAISRTPMCRCCCCQTRTEAPRGRPLRRRGPSTPTSMNGQWTRLRVERRAESAGL